MSFSLKEIAEKAGVSPSTVSKVINDRSDVGEETKARVRALLKEMNYTPKPRRKLSRRNTDAQVNLVLMKNPSSDPDPFYSPIVESISTTLSGHGIDSLYRTVETVDLSVEDLRKWLSGPAVRGTILIGGSFPGDFIERLRSIDPETVLVDNGYPGMHSVSMDNTGGAHLAVRHLIECGCKRIGFLSGCLDHASIARRLEGYTECLGSDVSLASPILLSTEGLSLEHGYDALARRESIDFDGLFCGNDKVALGAMRALKERGVNVPGKVRVVGFDNIEWAKHNDPSLTTIHIPKVQIGRMAAELLIANTGQETLPVDIRIGTKLVVRESTSGE